MFLPKLKDILRRKEPERTKVVINITPLYTCSRDIKDKGTNSDQGNGVIVGVHEVSEVVSAIRNGKAEEADEIKPEMVKHSEVTEIL